MNPPLLFGKPPRATWESRCDLTASSGTAVEYHWIVYPVEPFVRGLHGTWSWHFRDQNRGNFDSPQEAATALQEHLTQTHAAIGRLMGDK